MSALAAELSEVLFDTPAKDHLDRFTPSPDLLTFLLSPPSKSQRLALVAETLHIKSAHDSAAIALKDRPSPFLRKIESAETACSSRADELTLVDTGEEDQPSPSMCRDDVHSSIETL